MSCRGTRERLRRVSPLALAGFLLSCGPSSRSIPRLPVPEVEYGGCGAVYLPGPVCALNSNLKLSLWVSAAPGTKVEIDVGDRRLDVPGETVGDGRRFTLPIPPGVSPLTVRLLQPDGTFSSPWSLGLARPEVPGWFDEIWKLGTDKKRIRQRLEELRKAVPPKEQGLVLRGLSLLAMDDGRDGEAEALLEQGVATDHSHGSLSFEIEKTAWLARLYLSQGRFSEARERLAQIGPPPVAPYGSKYLAAFYRGLLAKGVGDYGSALEQMRQARGLAERIGNLPNRWMADLVLAGLLQDLGRSAEASKLFAALRADPHPESPCDLGDLLNNEAWSRLLAREAEEKTNDPMPMLEEARTIFDKESCASPEQRLNARLNLALADQHTDQWDRSRKRLDEARALALQPTLPQRLWWQDLEGRQAIAEHHPELALRLYDELERMAGEGLSLEGRFRAALGRAHARLASGRRATALAALADADRRIDEQSWHVPVNEGRDTLVGQREVATRLYLQLLLEDGRRQRAFALVRRARSRLLYQLAIRERLAQLTPTEQRLWDRALEKYHALRNATNQEAAQNWQLPGDQRRRAQATRASQLAQAQQGLDRAVAGLGDPGERGESSLSLPGPGEVILAYHPLRHGWVGFAAHGRDVEVATFDLPAGALADPSAPGSRRILAQSLLAPFRTAIEHAGRVRILAPGRLRSIDFHSLPFGGEPLLDRHLVVYSLDLPSRSSPAPPAGGTALLVADPEGDLPAARQEATAVAAAIHTWGPAWRLERLDATDAQAGKVGQELSRASLFHYAGHGTLSGFAGWDSTLTLAAGSRLTLGDLLTLRPVPRWIVLSACSAGHSSDQASGEGIGLANAFLLAGAQEVIAATRPVDDRIARDLMHELYRSWRPGMDLSRQLQRAQLACGRQHPEADCASFRLLEP